METTAAVQDAINYVNQSNHISEYRVSSMNAGEGLDSCDLGVRVAILETKLRQYDLYLQEQLKTLHLHSQCLGSLAAEVSSLRLVMGLRLPTSQ